MINSKNRSVAASINSKSALVWGSLMSKIIGFPDQVIASPIPPQMMRKASPRVA